ncbi:MAG: ABC transporter substrate-binding protein [Burkholderiales bacterium]|nr:ABC transporter substrate-binding protein [Burkholderiales bacterium]
MKRLLRLVMCAALAAWALNAPAKTLRMGIADDATTLDPHSANILGNSRILHSVYEGLVARDKDFKIVPALALSWSQPDPKTWRFKLRPNVKFHDGSPFTADDVVFSLERVLHPLSNLKSSVQGVGSAKKIDNLTVDLIMSEPNPVLILHLVNFRIMSKAWSTKHNTLAPQNHKEKEETYAARNTNGTGPFKVTVRQPDVKTVLSENPDWWNKNAPDRGNVKEVIWTPVKAPSTRIAALLSGELDMVIDPPIQDRERLKKTPGVKLQTGNEPRVYYLAFDAFRDELLYSNVKGKNPFKDVRVREAVALAIDVNGIINKVMRGYGRPTSLIVGKEVQGWVPDIDALRKVDIAKAKKLLADAGYPNGFEVTLDSTNQVPFGEIAQAIAPMLAQIGIKVNPSIIPNPSYSPKLEKFDSSFYIWGWGAVTVDSLYVLQALMRTQGAAKSGDGDANFGRYSNPKLDAIIDKIKTESDMKKRDALIFEALAIQKNDVGVLPLLQVVTAWAFKQNVTAPFATNNIPYFYRFSVR